MLVIQLTTVASLLALAAVTSAEEQFAEHHSFDFHAHSPLEEGIPNWIAGGHALYKDNSLRLTEDAQSQRGSLWNTMPLEESHEDWKIHLILKMTGSGRSLYGDGMALWLTKYMGVEGPVFGNMDYFTGLGIFFDTYDNAEVNHQHQHPWISGVINDGSESFSFEGPRLGGCHSVFRFHEGEEGAANLVSVEIVYKDGNLKLSVDTTNSNTYEECFSVPARIPSGGHLGLTASTGHLSDNHDLYALKFYYLDKEHTVEELEEINRAVNNTGVVQVLHEKTKEHAQAIEVLHAHLNQRLSGVHDSLSHAIMELQKSEEDSIRKLTQLEEQLKQRVEVRLQHLEEQLHIKVSSRTKDSGSGWLYPFLLFGITCVGVIVYVLVSTMRGSSRSSGGLNMGL